MGLNNTRRSQTFIKAYCVLDIEMDAKKADMVPSLWQMLQSAFREGRRAEQ